MRWVCLPLGLFLLAGGMITLVPSRHNTPPASATPVPAAAPSDRGDRHPNITVAYPDEAFSSSGGRVMDVTRPPYNAAGDGVTDDTRAFVGAYDDLIAGLRRAAEGSPRTMGPKLDAMWFQKEYSPILYVPNGVYKVSDSIIYSGPIQKTPNGISEYLWRVRIVGQNRDKTIIRLTDSNPRFQGRTARPVLSFGRHTFNNSPAQNVCRNLTIDTGRGNAGAVGLLFAGANISEISNVTVRSRDGRGFAGIWFNVDASQGWHHDITVEGFDHGILMRPYHATQITLEHITLLRQRLAGLTSRQSPTTVRDLVSQNSCPALVVEGAGSDAVVVDSFFSGAPGRSAVEVGNGQLFARDLTSVGYDSALRVKQAVLPGSSVKEYVSSGPVSLWPGTSTLSLRLPVQESPLPPNFPTDQWSSVDSYGAVGDGVADDTAAVQAALNSGKPVVCFPRIEYRLAEPVHVPATVKRIDCMFSTLNHAKFIVSRESKEPLVIRDGAQLTVLHEVERPLVLENLFFVFYNRHKTGTRSRLFVNNCSGLATVEAGFRNQKVWFRQVNSESRDRPYNFSAEGSDLWVLGFKCEGGTPSFRVARGSRLEVLGGLVNQTQEKGLFQSAFICEDSDMSVSAHTNLSANTFENLFLVLRNGQARTAGYARFVERGKGPLEVIVPLFTEYGRQPTGASR